MQIKSLDWEDPWRRKWQPTPVLLPEKSHRQRSLAGIHGVTESDVTEHSYFLELINKFFPLEDLLPT